MITFSNTPTITKLTHHGSFGGVVEAFCDACREAVSWVNYIRSGNDFIILKFGIDPHVLIKDATCAGDLIDAALEREAMRLGVTKLFLVHRDETVELVRTYKPQPFTMPSYNTTYAQYLN